MSEDLPGLSDVLPSITFLQSESVEFVNCYAAGTSCTPSRAALLTDLYPTQTAMYVTQGDAAAPSLVPTYTISGSTYTNSGYPTFGSYIQAQGYHSVYVGKWHLSDESNDYNDNGLNPYGFNYPTGDIPSPNGYPNEGTNGGYASAPHQGSDTYNNDADIVAEFASAMTGVWNNGKWLAVVSLINPHDISFYPQYLLNYCQVSTLMNPIQPNFTPATPSSGGLPALPQLYNSAAATTPLTCPGYDSVFTAHVTGKSILPSNVSNDLSSKPPIQTTYQTDTAAVNGSVDGASNGDWGDFLNVYYWLASCADSLIGNLSAPSSSTILGLAAQNLTSANLANTVIVFTSDHGEYGGAHGLAGKNASSYDEATHVPLFVRIPNQATMNRQRTQMVSLVDVFGLLSAFATNNGTVTGGALRWKAANPQLSSREDMISFLNSNSNRNVQRVLTSTDSRFSGQPYILHTTNEFYANAFSKQPYDNTEHFHIVGLRTGPATASVSATSGYKVVYYYQWDDTYVAAPVFTPTAQPSASFSEFYNLSSDSGETTNNSSSITSAIHTTFSGVITGEMQATMGTVNGVNLDTVLTGAQGIYNSYMSPPTGISISPSSPAHGGVTPVMIYVSGGNIQRGCTVIIQYPDNSYQYYPISDTVDPTGPIPVSVMLPTASTQYNLTVSNPSQSSMSINFSVT